MDPDRGTGIIENTIQSRNADVDPSVIRSNQIEINSPYGSNSINPEGHGAQSITPEPVSTPHGTSFSSPPIQTMVHEDGYDPNRIPSSVFITNASPMDWSSASNESLFSINMGNSFSGYQGIFKSGELGMIEGMHNPQIPFETFEAKANEGSNFSPNLPTLPETSNEQEIQQSANIKDDIRIQERPSNSSTNMREETKETHGYKAYPEENMVPSSISAPKGGAPPVERTNSIQNRLSKDSPKNRLSNESSKSSGSKNRLSNESSKSSGSKNRLSDESGRSCGSFAFPVLVSDVGKVSSFIVKPHKKVESQIKPHHQSEPPKPAPTQAAPRGRGCLCCIPGWLRCC